MARAVRVRPGGRRPTSSDVAREAGLSRATVGYVLNDVPNQSIPEATRQRVIDAAAKLGYTPSAAARSLRSGRSHLVLCLLPDWPVGPSVAGLVQGLTARLGEHGYTLVTHQRGSGSAPLAELWKTLTTAVVVVLDHLEPADAAALEASGLHVSALVRDGANDPRLLSVVDERVGQLQVDHLAEQGRRRIGYGYPADTRLTTFARPRLRGVRQACAELGLEQPLVAEVALEPDVLAAAVARWAEAGVDGLCVYNDELALGLLGALRRAGLAVPGDVAVIGVDDIPLAAVADPPLTTVVTDIAGSSGYLTELVLADLAGRPLRNPRVDADLMDVTVRESS